MAIKPTSIKFAPDVKRWLDEITDKEKYPLGPTVSQIANEAIRAYMTVVNPIKRDFVPRRPDAAILAQAADNLAKLTKREQARRDPKRKTKR